MLRQDEIQALLRQTGLASNASITLLKEHNHSYRIDDGDLTAYLKIYTKDWYGNDIQDTAFCVDHEAAAWRSLAEAGLAVPEVLLSGLSLENPLQRPFLLVRALRGAPLTMVAQDAPPEQLPAMLHSVGRYMAAMHRIRFEYPGYISSSGPASYPAADQYQHSIWTFEQFSRDARRTWQADRQAVDGALMDSVEQFYAQLAPALEQAYARPRFTHGDCHAQHFYVYSQCGEWRVSGVIDMEVASAGDRGADLFKFVVEMAALFPVESGWWRPLFAGYGDEPDFDLLRLRMLAAHHANYAWIWPGTRAAILRHILDARDWRSLFDLRPLRAYG